MAETKSTGTRRISLPFESTDVQPYIFASYGHDDKEIVFPLLRELYEAGYNVWYDEGITIGEKYDEVIENHIRQSAVFILFASGLSVSRPYVTDIELVIAAGNKAAPILPLLIEENVDIPENAARLLPETRFTALGQIIDELERLGLENHGRRTAVPIERDVPQYWFDGHDIAPAGGGKNNVLSKEAPYACLAFDPADLEVCNPYAKELFFAGYNVRSCENSTEAERGELLASDDCMAYVPFVTKRYIESGRLESDYLLARRYGKKLIALYAAAGGRNGGNESTTLPAGIAEEFSLIQGLSLNELTTNDFISKLEAELERLGCYASMENGSVVRRSFEIKDFLYDFTEDGKGLVLTKYRGTGAELNVRRAYSGFPVRILEKSVFEDCDGLINVSIADGVGAVGEAAFANCSGLERVRLPEGIKRIADSTFYSCCSLCRVEIPSSVESIGYGAFWSCTALSDVIMYEGLKAIEGEAFLSCAFTSIAIPKSVDSIGAYAFSGCEDLTELSLPDGIAFIDEETFSGCCSLERLRIPEGVSEICERAFSDCDALEAVYIPDSVCDIGEDAFCGCDNLTVICSPGSEAWEFCEENEIECAAPEKAQGTADIEETETEAESPAPVVPSTQEDTAPAEEKSVPRRRWWIWLAVLLLAAAAAFGCMFNEIIGFFGSLLG